MKVGEQLPAAFQFDLVLCFPLVDESVRRFRVGAKFQNQSGNFCLQARDILSEPRSGKRLPMRISGQVVDLVAQPRKLESPTHDKIRTCHFLDGCVWFPLAISTISSAE